MYNITIIHFSKTIAPVGDEFDFKTTNVCIDMDVNSLLG